jgi:catechol 2,3-dioxygenase-like lactoylglutathione lyase family enzyme
VGRAQGGRSADRPQRPPGGVPGRRRRRGHRVRPDEGIESAVEELKGKGVEFAGDVSDHPWGRVASFKDPDGNDLQLYEPPAA